MQTVPPPPALDAASAQPAEVAAANAPPRAGGLRERPAPRTARTAKSQRRAGAGRPPPPRRARTGRRSRDHPRHRLRRHRPHRGGERHPRRDDPQRRPRRPLAGREPRHHRRLLRGPRRRARRPGPGAHLRRRGRRARALRADADPRADRPQPRRSPAPGGSGCSPRCSPSRSPSCSPSTLVPLVGEGPLESKNGDTTAVATAVFGTWVWPFELLSVLLLAALIGAFAVSRMPSGRRQPLVPRRATPATAAAGAPP